MKNSFPPDQLKRSEYTIPGFTEKTREFCLYAGCAGVLFSIISIAHVLSAALFSWLTLILIIPNISAAVSFILMVKAYRYLLISFNSTLVLFVFYFILVVYLFKNFVFVFSPSTLLLFLYVLALVVYAYITDLPWKLKDHSLRKKEDEDYWNGKL